MRHSYTSALNRHWLAPAVGVLVLLAGPAAQAQTTKIEAEASTLSGAAVVASTITPASGGSYVDYNGKPSAVSFAYTATADGAYDVLVRYASPFDFKIGAMAVNGGGNFPVYFNSTKTGSTFRSTSRLRVALKNGANTIVISDGDFGFFGIDFIEVRPAGAVTALTPSAAGRVEAEAGVLTGTQAYVRDGDTAPRSGDSYVSGFSQVAAVGSTISLPVNVATAGLYQITVGARGVFDAKSIDVAVNTGGAEASKHTVALGPTSTTFQPFAVTKLNLAAGTTTINITSQTAYVEVDYVDVTAATGTATKASAEAQKALSAYPNPTNGQGLTVRLEVAAARAATFELVNALGQRVLSTDRSLNVGTNQFQLATDRVAGGIYQLVVRGDNQPLLVKRVVIN